MNDFCFDFVDKSAVKSVRRPFCEFCSVVIHHCYLLRLFCYESFASVILKVNLVPVCLSYFYGSYL